MALDVRTDAATSITPTSAILNGTVSHFALRDAAMEGNMIMHGALQKPKLIEVDDRFTFPLGNLEVKVQ